MSDLKRSDFDYVLPPELIAQAPLPQRSASRLLLLQGETGQWQDRRFGELPELLRAGDLLVFNDTRVVPARLPARKPTGGRVEVFLERALPGGRALVQLRDSKSVRPGMCLTSAGGSVRLLERVGELWEIELPSDAHSFFEQHGRVPLPPYIRRPLEESDAQRYQSIWARVPGAVAAPTASLHFDAPLLAALAAKGIEHAWLTLHVGAGTFAPVRDEDLDRHTLHSEAFELAAAAVEAIGRARRRGGRVIAVGTTVARALESAARPVATVGPATGADSATGSGTAPPLQATSGETTLFIRPGFEFRVVDGLLTNFHLPQSTLLMLVAAFAGRAQVLAAYAHAVEARYRFFSYGDAMLMWPQQPRASGMAT
jgi:S-adenosylmethionine:tRNA ribosyltransferase-isomerase